MSGRGRRRALLAVAVTAGVTAAAAGALAPAKATTMTTTPWKIANVWRSATGWFNSVAATGPNNAWAVGSSGTGPIVAHWNGKAWQTVTAGIFQGFTYLTQVRAPAANNVWVLAQGAGGSEKALRFDGAHWHAVDLPPELLGDGDLIVLGPKDAWLREDGWETVAGTPQTLTWHWNGSAWTAHPIHAIVGSFAGVSDANIEAVGLSGQQNGPGPGDVRAYKWTGSRWIAMGIPTAAAGPNGTLIAMDSASDVWIAAQTRDEMSAFALHWNGRAWARLNPPKDSPASPGPVPDGHGGVWLGPWMYWTGHAWVNATYFTPPGGWDIAPNDMGKVPGTANSFWGVGSAALGAGPARPAVMYYGPKP